MGAKSKRKPFYFRFPFLYISVVILLASTFIGFYTVYKWFANDSTYQTNHVKEKFIEGWSSYNRTNVATFPVWKIPEPLHKCNLYPSPVIIGFVADWLRLNLKNSHLTSQEFNSLSMPAIPFHTESDSKLKLRLFSTAKKWQERDEVERWKLKLGLKLRIEFKEGSSGY